MELRPCACGETSIDGLAHSLVQAPAGLAALFEGPCPRCGTPRRFEFLAPDRPSFPGDAFGGPEPSSLLDAGEWLAASDAAASRVPAAPPADAGARAAAQRTLTRAVRALEEVLKFAPAGAREVPADARQSPTGQRLAAAEPGRFSRARLEARLGAYRDLLKNAYGAS